MPNMNECPFDEGTMQPLSPKDVTDLFVSMLVSPTSNVAGLMRASARKQGGGDVRKCGSCGFVAIFAP